MEAAIIAFGVAELGALLAWAGWVSTKLNHIEKTTVETFARMNATLQDHHTRITELESFFPRTINIYPQGPDHD